MATMTTCDECGKQFADNATLWRLESPIVRTFGDPPSGDFCSLACLAWWATRYVQPQRKPAPSDVGKVDDAVRAGILAGLRAALSGTRD